MSKELKPCHRKRCEGSKRVMVRGEAPEMWWIRCQTCRCCGECCKTKAEAIAAWNARPEPEEFPVMGGVDTIQSLRAKCKSLTAKLKASEKGLRCDKGETVCPDSKCWVALERDSHIATIEALKAKLKVSEKRVGDMEALLDRIRAVACGEEQIQCDGVYNDSDGLKWIYDTINKFEDIKT